LRITKTRPPRFKVGTGRRVPLIHRGLTLELRWHGDIGSDIIRTDSAACREAGDDDRSKEVFR